MWATQTSQKKMLVANRLEPVGMFHQGWLEDQGGQGGCAVRIEKDVKYSKNKNKDDAVCI